MANKHTKRCSTSLIIRNANQSLLSLLAKIKCSIRNANQTTMRYHLMQSERLLTKSLQTINAGEGAEKREPAYTVGGNAN